MLYTPALVNVAVAGTAVQVVSSRTAATWVVIQALPGNAGTVYVGPSGVGNGATSKGLRIVQSGSITLPFAGANSPYDLATIFVNADNNNDKVCVMYGRV